MSKFNSNGIFYLPWIWSNNPLFGCIYVRTQYILFSVLYVHIYLKAAMQHAMHAVAACIRSTVVSAHNHFAFISLYILHCIYWLTECTWFELYQDCLDSPEASACSAWCGIHYVRTYIISILYYCYLQCCVSTLCGWSELSHLTLLTCVHYLV